MPLIVLLNLIFTPFLALGVLFVMLATAAKAIFPRQVGIKWRTIIAIFLLDAFLTVALGALGVAIR